MDISSENITEAYFDYKDEADEDGVIYGLYSYNEYSIAVRKEELDIGDDVKYRLILEDYLNKLVYPVNTLDDALTVINIIEAGKIKSSEEND